MVSSWQSALDAVEVTYKELNDIASEMTEEFFTPINKLIDDLKNINDLTNDEIRNYMIQLALNAAGLGEVKEKSALKAQVAEALRKETHARSYAAAEGTSANRENTALLNSQQQIVAEVLYELIANLFKTKLDEVHRSIDVLKSVLMSRNMEAKLTAHVID